MADDEVLRYSIEVLAAKAGLSVDEFRAKVRAAKADIDALNKAMPGMFPPGTSHETIGAALGYDPAVIRGAVDGFTEVGAAVTSVGTQSQQAAPKVQSIRTALAGLFNAIKSGQGVAQNFNIVWQAMVAGLASFAIYQAFNAAIQGIQQFIQKLNEAAVVAQKFLDAYFKLQVGLRDAQRKGFDATLGDLTRFANEFQAKYPQFSKTSIIEGMSDLIFRTKELGLTSAQAFKLFEAAAALAVSSGKDISEVLKEIAQAASSGYSEGLQRMGILINKNVITQRAYAEGAKNSSEAMDLQRRATATLNIVLEQTSGIIEDTTQKQKTLAGQTEIVAAKTTDVTEYLGQAWLPFKNGIDDTIASFLNLVGIVLTGVNQIVGAVDGAGRAVGTVLHDLFSGRFFSGENVFAILGEDINKGFTDVFRERGIILDAFGNEVVEKNKEIYDQFGMTPEQAQKAQDAIAKFYDDLLSMTDKYQTEIENAEEKYQRDLLDIDVQGARKREELAIDLERKLADITLDLGRNYKDAQVDYQRDLVDIDVQANRKIEEARKASAQNKIDIEKKYRDDIKKLQNNLIFDLEEAVRSGDVIQIRQLQRQYQRDLANLALGKNENIGNETQSLEQKINDINAQREFDKQQRLIDYQQKKADLDRQAAQQRLDAQTRYQQELADLRQSMADQRKDRQKAYNDQLKDMHTAFQNRLRLASEALIKEVGLNAQAASAIAGYMMQLYGQNGLFQQVYDYMMAYIAQGQADILKIITPPTLTAIPDTGTNTGTSALPDQGPTTTKVQIDLGPDLVAKVIETAVGTVADITERSM